MTSFKVDNTMHNPNWLLPSSPAANTTQQRFSSKGRKAARIGSVSLPFILLLLNLWRVPIIILIATTGAPPTCAASIAVVGSSSNSSDTYNSQRKAPSKLSFNLNEDGNGGSADLLSISVGNLLFHKPKETAPSQAKKAGLVKRGGGEASITSNQDVTTLALALNNSTSIAVGNINSNHINVEVTVGTSSGNPIRYPPQFNK